MSGVGYGKVNIPVQDVLIGESFLYGQSEWWPYIKELNEGVGLLKLENALLNARINYMMSNPTTFTSVYIYYDSSGWFEEFFPEGVNTKGKIYVLIRDIRGYFLTGLVWL